MAAKKRFFSDLRLNYRRVLERSFLIALLFLCILFYAFPAFNASPASFEKPNHVIDLVDIPVTEQKQRLPKPDQPKIPVQSEEEEIMDEVPIDFTEMQKEWIERNEFNEPDGPVEIIDFVFVEEKPQLVKKVNPYYPELARKAGIEGMVVVDIVIDTEGDVESARIFKSIAMLDQAALAAALQFKFTPGRQRDRLVKVKMRVPFSFRLH